MNMHPATLSRLAGRLVIILAVVLAASLFAPDRARTEGATELGTFQTLLATTELFIDVLDDATETITWTGVGSLTVHGPGGALVGVYGSGATIVPTDGVGAYRLSLSQDQVPPWDFVVNGASGGRLHSRRWMFDSGGYQQSRSVSASFCALLEGGGGAPSGDLVIETQVAGLAGFVYDVLANSTGLVNQGTGWPRLGLASLPLADASVDPEHRVYLNPPDRANHSALAPTVVLSSYPAAFMPVVQTFEVSFSSDVDGHALLIVDENMDGVFDPTAEVVAWDAVSAGASVLSWDGRDRWGNVPAPGAYDARLVLATGLYFFPAVDIETMYEGCRFFQVDAVGFRAPLVSYWNDELVQGDAVLMPNAEYGLENPGPFGLAAGPYADPTAPNVNARSWGNFNALGKGNNAILNTYTWVDEDTAPLSFSILDPTGRPFADPASGAGVRSVIPNPTAGEADISFGLDRAQRIEIAVFDASGRRIRTIERGVLSPGTHHVTWDGRDVHGGRVAAGAYFVQLVCPSGRTTRVINILK